MATRHSNAGKTSSPGESHVFTEQSSLDGFAEDGHRAAQRTNFNRMAAEPAVEFLGEVGGGGEAAGRVFLQALQAERVEVGGDLAVELRRGRRGRRGGFGRAATSGRARLGTDPR